MHEERRLTGRLGGLTTITRHGADRVAARAREGFLARFEREVDPDGSLHPDERRRRAETARRLYMNQLALKSRQARAARKADQ